MDRDLTIGQLARRAGVHVETIRYYQRRGLLHQPPRPAGGYRRYSAASVARIQFIRRAQQLGFSLREIGELLQLGEGHCAGVRERAAAKRAQIQDQIRDLQRLQATLERLIDSCHETPGTPCPIVQALSTEDELLGEEAGSWKLEARS
ncbi:MerR family transcriptional regulator [Thiohalobacter sp. IOR34]|uniref:MerR family transcriptional regulator n=1 Tax=Thiohalobacter sp. IOR34 TaxID=3057176 RepID=UPI0025B065BF|nr:MerR family transcriptional regulator [Thiohalobacter sp. IOR34]WJW76380.1 MerR family transcriptional regulator [Thiohalobacter sp. IOR34]